MYVQAKQLDPDFGMDGEDEDGWDEALGYLDACGPGFHLQIARTASADKNLVSSSVVSNGSDLSNLLIDESQKEKVRTTGPGEGRQISLQDRRQACRLLYSTQLPKPPGGARMRPHVCSQKTRAAIHKYAAPTLSVSMQSALEQADMDATKSIVSVAKKAQDLFRQQQKIERDVQTRHLPLYYFSKIFRGGHKPKTSNVAELYHLDLSISIYHPPQSHFSSTAAGGGTPWLACPGLAST